MLSTDKQTDRQTKATKNITSFAKEVITVDSTNDGCQYQTDFVSVRDMTVVGVRLMRNDC